MFEIESRLNTRFPQCKHNSEGETKITKFRMIFQAERDVFINPGETCLDFNSDEVALKTQDYILINKEFVV